MLDSQLSRTLHPEKQWLTQAGGMHVSRRVSSVVNFSMKYADYLLPAPHYVLAQSVRWKSGQSKDLVLRNREQPPPSLSVTLSNSDLTALALPGIYGRVQWANEDLVNDV